MKKVFLYSMMLASVFFVSSCTEEDNVTGTNTDREFMTMFRADKNTGDGDDQFACRVVDNNEVFLCWYTVDGCAGYEIKWGVITSSDGQSAWEALEAAGGLAGDTIIANPNQFTLNIKHLDYNTPYRFAIRVLHSLDPNDPLNSKWYGYGDGRRAWDYLGLQTDLRYTTPAIMKVEYKAKNDPLYYEAFDVHINRGTSQFTEAQMKDFAEQQITLDDGSLMNVFPLQDGHFKVDYMEIKAGSSNPDAVVPDEYKHYDLKNANWEDDKIVIPVKGLQSNAIYEVNIYNEDIPYKADAAFNFVGPRVKGAAGAPILIKHNPAVLDTIIYDGQPGHEVDIANWDACKISGILTNFMTDMSMSENQVFYLEGGKAYYISETVSIDKGFTLMTDPADIAAGKGPAKLYMGSMTYSGISEANTNTCSFQISRASRAGDDASSVLAIDSIRFRNLDISAPMAHNNGHKNEFMKASDGNYFINDGGNHMSYDLSYFEVDSCTFQGFIRGFIRVQTSKTKYIQEFVFQNSELYNCGYYDSGGGGFGLFSLKGGTDQGNCFKNFTVKNCTFYDSSLGNLINNYKEEFATWDTGSEYNITVANNTFVNFGSLGTSGCILYFEGAIPKGTTLTVENNLFMLARDEKDVMRETLYCAGSRFKNLAVGLKDNPVTCNVRNNWSTSSNLYGTTGQIFTNYAFTGTKDGIAGLCVDNNYANCTYGQDELSIHVDDLSNTELMKSPNPKHTGYESATTAFSDAFHTENLDGLYFNDTEKVRNSNIYKLKVGAPKWRDGIGK